MSGRPDILPIDEWFYETDDRIVLCDPFTGDDLQPDRPPAFFAQDFRMLNGRHFLEHNGERFVTTALWGRMEEAQDLGATDAFERHTSRTQVAGYMLHSTTPDEYLNYLQSTFALYSPEELRNNIAFARDYEERAQHGLGGYRDRILRAYAANNTPNFRFDVDVTNHDGEPVAAEHLKEISRAVGGEQDENLRGIGDFVETIVREEYYMGQIGHQLLRLDRQDVLPRSDEVGMVLTMGMVHSGISKKLMERYGMAVKSTMVTPRERVPLVHRRGVFSRIIGRCSITESDLLEMGGAPLEEPES